MKCEKGSALVMTVVMLPVFVALLVLVSAAGSLYAIQSSLQGAVDMAALAGVQEICWENLAAGTIRLIPEAAENQALTLLGANLASVPRACPSRAEIVVHVLNAGPGEPLQHPGSGRILNYPTVWVAVRLPVEPAGLPRGTEIWLQATADASVEPRR